jgi:hypothetical protein
VPTIGLRSDHGSDEIPVSHHDLVQCPPVALTTVTPDGYPQTSMVWCDFDGVCVRGQHHAGLRQRAQYAPQPAGHTAVLRPPPAAALPVWAE